LICGEPFMPISQVQPISVVGKRRCVTRAVAALLWFNRRLRLRGAGALARKATMILIPAKRVILTMPEKPPVSAIFSSPTGRRYGLS
jgi:hypothetical protein